VATTTDSGPRVIIAGSGHGIRGAFTDLAFTGLDTAIDANGQRQLPTPPGDALEELAPAR